MSAGADRVKAHIHEGYASLLLVKDCAFCGGYGWLDDKSNAQVAKSFGGTISSSPVPPPIKCSQCVGGRQSREVNVGDFLDWLVEELRRYADNNPKALLDAFVNATELVMTARTAAAAGLDADGKPRPY